MYYGAEIGIEMSDKSVQKRKFILETARNVFAEKGFRSVTMKDIVEACEISGKTAREVSDETADADKCEKNHRIEHDRSPLSHCCHNPTSSEETVRM